MTFYNPRLMFVKYQPLVDYLSDRTGRGWELSVSRSYDETVGDLCGGRVTLAYLGPLTYVRARARCGAEPLLRLQTGGRAVFHSDVLVRSESPFERLEDLAGHRIGFGDPLSTSSHLVPRAMLQDAGLEPGRDFECRYYGQHERAARAVLMGEVEACGVRDVIGEVFLRRGLRRLARSGPVPAYPLVISPDSPSGAARDPDLGPARLPGRRPDLAATRRGGTSSWSGGSPPTVRLGLRPGARLADRVFGPGFASRPERELRCR